MTQESIPKSVNSEILVSTLKKVFNKSKSGHPLRIDPDSNQIRLKNDKNNLGIVYLEAPYISLPSYEVLKLIQMGKCCSYCGEVLKIYDNGKMKDDGNRGKREKQTTVEKHERYINGLDCSNCEVRWCDKQCKELDFKHDLLYHRPSNKSSTHAFIDTNGVEKDTFYFDKWKSLETLLLKENLDLCYNTIICILHIYYDDNLLTGYESLRCLDTNDEKSYDEYLESSNTDHKQIWEKFLSCFKKFEMSYVKFLQYMAIFKMNNYNGSIYLIFSALAKSNIKEPNLKIEYFDGNTKRDYEEFLIKTGDNNSVKIFKHHVIDSPTVKPIYTNKTSGILDKKIIQILNTSKISTQEELTIMDQDYSNPIDLEDDDFAFISDDNGDVDIPKIILPMPTSNNGNKQPKIRNASFTSSGASFGEGIIKYNRDQIREMLENMSQNLKLDEESSDELDEVIDDEVSSSFGSSVNQNLVVSMVKNLQMAPSASQRRKSVKFEDNITTIQT